MLSEVFLWSTPLARWRLVSGKIVLIIFDDRLEIKLPTNKYLFALFDHFLAAYKFHAT